MRNCQLGAPLPPPCGEFFSPLSVSADMGIAGVIRTCSVLLSCPAPLLTLSLSPFEPRRFSEISKELPFEALRQLQHGGIA